MPSFSFKNFSNVVLIYSKHFYHFNSLFVPKANLYFITRKIVFKFYFLNHHSLLLILFFYQTVHFEILQYLSKLVATFLGLSNKLLTLLGQICSIGRKLYIKKAVCKESCLKNLKNSTRGKQNNFMICVLEQLLLVCD